MQATIGDRLHVHGRTVGESEHVGEIIEVRGVSGEPPYVVKFGDGHTGLVFPGPDAVVEKVAGEGNGSGRNDGRNNGRNSGRATRRRVGW